MLCETCGGGHNVSQYPIARALVVPMEQVNFVSSGQRLQRSPYSTIYNPGLRTHPNLTWGGQGQQIQQRPPHPPRFQLQPLPPKDKIFHQRCVGKVHG